MNTPRTLIAASLVAALFAGTSAFAQEATPDTWTQVQASKTRAQVQVELAQARADGSIKAVSAGYIEPAKSVKSRADVRAEVDRARASGELEALQAEAYTGFISPMPTRVAQAAR